MTNARNATRTATAARGDYSLAVRMPDRTIHLAAVLAAAVTTAAVLAAAPTGTAGSATPPLCQTPGLVVWLNTQGNGAAGSVYYTLELTNLSGHACTLNGYPYVYAVTLAGSTLGSVGSFDHVHQTATVTLANGATAKSVLRIVQAANFPESACHRVTAAGLRVYPPNQTRATRIPFPFDACSRKGPVVLSVQAVQKG